LFEAAGLAGIVLASACGQKGVCGKCAVAIETGPGVVCSKCGAVPDGAAGERCEKCGRPLKVSGFRSRQVLACQYEVQSDLTVTVPDSARYFEARILTRGVEAQSGIEPDVYKKYDPGAKVGELFGLAVDVGTTTVVADLVDLVAGTCVATAATLNPQAKYGDDVVNRISYATTEEGRKELQQLIIGCVNELIEKLCREGGINYRQILELCAVGNTTMNHLLLGLPIEQLGQAPYKAYRLEAADVAPTELGLKINADGNVHTVENIAGFVGSDTVAAALATNIAEAESGTLLVDVGTNGEIVLAAAGELYAASCAAGPAFEGARIEQGSRAVAGAIEAVVVNGDDNDIDLDVIGAGPPQSICGSGLIDAVAVMRELGVLDRTGRIVEPAELPDGTSERIRSRLARKGSEPAFILSHRPLVVLTQQDIRQTQLAKAAIRTGIELLQQKVGVADNNIEQVLLAGAFGNYIKRESALAIGLLPAVEPEKIQFVGNAALVGVRLTLLSRKAREAAGKLAQRIKYIELAKQAHFADVYANAMLF